MVSPNSNSYTDVVLQIVFRYLSGNSRSFDEEYSYCETIAVDGGLVQSQHDFNATSGFCLVTVHKLYHVGPAGHNSV